jgi:hypothetical protein
MYLKSAFTSMVVFRVVTPYGLADVYKRFEGNILPPSSGLDMEAVCPSETSVHMYKCTRPQKPEYHHGHIHRLENLKCQRKFFKLNVNCTFQVGNTRKNVIKIHHLKQQANDSNTDKPIEASTGLFILVGQA